MIKRTLSFLLAFVLVLGMVQFPVSAEESVADQTAPVSEPVQTVTDEPVTAEPVSNGTEVITEGGEAVTTERYPNAIALQTGESKTYAFDDLTAADGDMLLLSFDVRCETACAELSITIDFSGTDVTMKYYAPIQWSRIYMPVACSGSFNKVTVTVKTNSVLIGAATAENKGSATIEDMNLQSGMWMIDQYEDVVLDADMGVKNTNQDIYSQMGITSSNCIDLVISSCGNYIYSIGGGYLTVTDVSDPANPRVRAIYNNPDYPTDYGDTRQIALIPDGGKTGDAVIFTGRISGAFIVDVSDPDDPVETAHYDALEMATGIATYEGYAFIANRQYGVEVVDVSDIYKPVHLGTVARGGEIQSCKVVDGILYAGAYDINKVEMYDLTDLLNPKYLGAASLNGRGDAMTVATVNGRTYLYAGTGHHSATGLTSGPLTNLNYGQGNGLEIFDVTDPTNPVLLSVSKTDGRFCHSKCDYWGAEVSIHNDRVYVYLLSTYNGVYVYDATDPTAPVRLAHVTARVDKDSPYYNTSNFSHTSSVYPPVFQYDPNEYKQAPMGSIAVHEGALYMAGVYTDLHVYQADWAHPIAEDPDPVPVAPTTPYYDDSLVTVRPGGQTVAVANHGNYMYVAAGEQGILVYSKDLKTLYKTIPVEDLCYDLYIQNGILYAAEGRNGVAVYTIGADGLTLTETKRYISSVDLVTTVRPSPTGKFVALHVGSTRGEIVDISGTPKLVVNCSTATQAYHHNVELTANGRYVVFWGLSGNEQWYDFGANDGNSTPKRLPISPFKSRAAMAGGYTGYKGNVIIQTRSNGYVYYDPTAVTAAQVEDMALNKLIKAANGYGSATKTSIYGRGFVYENLLISCDRVYGRMYITDISDIDNPVLLKSWTGVKGNPDIATVVDKTLYIPMGYEGIMMLDLEDYLTPHVHCICGGLGEKGDHTACSDVKWTPISEALKAAGMTAQTADFGKLPSGNYYLDTDVVVTGTSAIGAMTSTTSTQPKTVKNISLCLNGYNITTTKTRVFGNTNMDSELNICDCSGKKDAKGDWSFGGTVYGGTNSNGQIIYTYAGSTLNIYGGNFTSNNTASAGGLIALACENCGDQDGDGDYDTDDRSVCKQPSVFNLYNGRLHDGKAGSGGNLVIYHTANANLYGGVITGGTATSGSGGNIISYSTGTLTIDGAVIKNGTSSTYGGNINMNTAGGNLIINSGTISGGTAGSYGGNIVNSATMKLYGGTISDGSAGSYGGNIHNAKTFYMYGGTVSGGSAGNNAGGNIIVGTGSTFNMYGGTVKNGTASTSYGGNIQALGTVYLCGGTIENGTAKYGGNVAVYNKGKLYTLKSSSTREDLLVSGGTATSGQGSNIYIGYTSATPPTASFKWGSFLRGDIYAGTYANVTIAENPVIDYLLITSGIKVTFNAFTAGGSVKVKMTDRTGVFGTGTAANVNYLTADYEVKHEGGNLSLVAPGSFTLRYDDRKNLSDLIGADATNVTITNQNVTSKKVGTNTADAAVLTYDATTDTLYAVGTGTATINANGKSYSVTVEAAPISLLMITGHSIGEGYLADGDLSVVCEAGQVYGSYGRESLTSNAGGLGYGADTRVSDSLDIYAPGNGGSASGAAGMGWRWNQLTGEKVWVLNAAVSGACINEWQPGAKNHSGRYSDYYYTAVTMFNNAQTVIKNEVAAGHYTFSHSAMFYFNAGNFNWYEGWTQEKLEQDYATFWGGMKQALSMDIDGDGVHETVESLGLIPLWSPGNNTYGYDKAASYYMAASNEYPDIYIALDYRSWVTDLDSFPVYDYETQSGEYWQPESIQHTNKGGTSDKSIFCYNDTTHHSQIGYNAVGICIAENLLARLGGTQTTTAVWQTVDAKDAPGIITVDVGDSVSLVPLLEPVYGSDVTITVTGSLEKTYPVIITATGNEGGTVTMTKNGQVLDTVTIEVRAEHKHCLCGGIGKIGDHTTCADVKWTPISVALQEVGLTTQTADFGKLPSGYYYLDEDLQVTGISHIGTASGVTATTVKNIRICLNGKKITTTRSRVFGYIRAGSVLSIADCTGSGTVYGGTATYGQILYTYAKATANIFGGNFTSNNTATAGGLFAIASDQCGDLNGDGAENDTDRKLTAAKSVLNIYGGKLYGGKAPNGGNIVVYHGCDMNMYGGTITGGTATTAAGGNIISYSTGTILLRGGTIEKGTSGTYGGNIYMSAADGTLTIDGGKVIDGTSKTYGGNICNGATFNLRSGSVEGGTAGSYSGNIHNSKNFYMYDGSVKGGTAKAGAAGNIMAGTGSKFCIYGGTVEDGSATTQGGNIHVLGDAYLCGGTIRGGSAKQGGNIAVYNKGYLKSMISANTKAPLIVENGTASAEGQNLYVGYTGGTTPKIELQTGTFTGQVYVGDDANASITNDAVLTDLYISKGNTCNITDLTHGAAITISMEDVTAAIGSGTAKELQYLQSADERYIIVCLDGKLYLADAAATDSFELRYDDRKNLSRLIGVDATNVTVTDQVVTSKKIGSDTADAAVLTYDASTDTLYAVGTGTANLNVNGKTYHVTVKAAPISLFMITGHSVGIGEQGNAAQSVVVEAGQAYSTHRYQTRTDTGSNKIIDPAEVTDTTGLGYAAASRLTGIDDFAPGEGGTIGQGSALAYQWNQLTGEKVWILNAAVGGSCINEWVPGAKGHSSIYTYHYETSVAAFQNAQKILAQEIAAGHYTLSHMAVIYHSAANFSYAGYADWTYESLKDDYTRLWEGLKTDLAMDMDGDGTSETVEALGFVPLQTVGGTNSFTQDKPVNYYMAASGEYDDVFMASLITRNWMTSAGLASFPEIDYETQSAAVAMPESVYHTAQGGTSNNSVFCAADTVHLSQVAYNAQGIEIANNLNAWYTNSTITSGKLQTVDAKDAAENMMVDLGETVVFVPVVEPVYGNGMEVTVTGDLKMTFPLSITATGDEGGTVTISANGVTLDTVTISVKAQHKHCVCGGNAVGIGDHTNCKDVIFTPISEALKAAGMTAQTVDFGKLPSGNYYLDTDVVVTGTSAIGAMTGTTSTQPKTVKNISLCLNGHNITTTKTRVFGNTNMDSELNICDCSGKKDAKGDWSFGGTVYGGTAAYGQIIYTYAGSTLNIYGGNFTSDNTATAGGLIALACENCGDQDGDGDYDEDDRSACKQPSVFNLYNGRLHDGKAANGGNIVLYHSAEMNMFGGVITGGEATTGNGGNIYSYSNGSMNIRGGEISNGTSTKGYGGNIVNSGGTLRLYGGEVLGGTAATYAGSIHNAKTFYMYGGTVSGGRSGNNAGGNIMVGTGATFNIYGGTVKNGTASTSYGGNIQALGTVYLCGGTIENGTATYGGNVAVYNKGKLYTLKSSNTKEDLLVQNGTATTGQGGNMYIGYTSATPPTANFKWGSFVSGDIYAGPYANVTIGENPVIDYLYVSSGIKVTFNAFTEGGSVKVKMADVNAAIGTGTAANAKYLHSADESYIVTCRDGQYYLAVPVAKAGETLYATVSEAAENGYVVLLTDVTEDVVISEQVYLDLAGHTLTGSVTGSGTLYGMDSATDTYTAGGRITGTVSCNIETQFKTNVTGKIRRYMAIADDNGYTFNRFYIGVTHMHLKPGADGVGYKATVAGNDAVLAQIEGYGYKFWITEDKVATATKSGTGLENMNTVTARVQNFDVETYGETPINGTVFIELKDGTVIESSVAAFTLRDMLETVSANAGSYTDTQLSAVKAMVARFSDAMANWSIDSLR